MAQSAIVNHFFDFFLIIFTGTRVLTVEVEEMEREVVVRCVFRHTLSDRCYVQLVTHEMERGFYQGGCVEGEGEGVRRFSGLLPASYTVLVYGLTATEREEDSCSPTARDPDYISVATVSGPSFPTSQPSATDLRGRYNNSLLCKTIAPSFLQPRAHSLKELQTLFVVKVSSYVVGTEFTDVLATLK